MDDTAGPSLADKASGSTGQVRLTLRYISVWSCAKTSFLCGVGLGLLSAVALLLLWVVLRLLGVFAQLDSLLSGTSTGSGSISGTLGVGQVLAFAFLVGVLNTLGATLAGILGAALYNLGVRMTGGATLGFSQEGAPG